MRRTTNPREVQDFLKQRLLLEQRLSKELLEEFGRGSLNEALLRAVLSMLLFLDRLEGPAAEVVHKQERDQNFLAGLKQNKGTVRGALENLMDKGRSFPVVHCADLIRFYGEVIDDASKDGSLGWFRAERAKQIGWRYGGGGEYFKALLDPRHRAAADKGSVWQKTPTEEFPVGGRIRKKPNEVPVNPFAAGVNPYYDIVPGKSFDHPIYKALGVEKGAGQGSTKWVLQNASTLRKIDLVFGLPFGADISGTTTDCMYFLSGYGDLRAKDPLLMMLPLATIVSEYHHSLLEVALAMSLRKVIDYRVGFYTTLLPPLPAGVNAHPQRANVAEILSRYENHPENHHVLVYYLDNSTKIGGCYIAESPEFEAFKKMATCDIRMWPTFNAIGDYPSEASIHALLTEHNLMGSAYGAVRSSLRKT